jgi:hypothetical protein
MHFAAAKKSNVGASLLAMAECQSTKILDGPAISRAGSLPQWICGVDAFAVAK